MRLCRALAVTTMLVCTGVQAGYDCGSIKASEPKLSRIVLDKEIKSIHIFTQLKIAIRRGDDVKRDYLFRELGMSNFLQREAMAPLKECIEGYQGRM